MMKALDRAAQLAFAIAFLGTSALASPARLRAEEANPWVAIQHGFENPPHESRPETWFHLIGGNVSKDGLTNDLEAIADAGLQGIQLFHGSGREWPGVEPQIRCLSPTWDSMIEHVADETQRLDLRFTMQNCPGWAMSGGPWITPDKAMRHLIVSRENVTGGGPIRVRLERPQPSNKDWRDYRDVALLAFPTPTGDHVGWLKPDKIQSYPQDTGWAELLAGNAAKIQVPVNDEPAWLELRFTEPITLRSIELPPIELLMKRYNFDPDSQIAVQVPDGKRWNEIVRHIVPRGTWQDRQPEIPYVLAVPDAVSVRYRIVFENNHPLEVSQLRLSTAARPQDWRAQAGYALRSLERAAAPIQSPDAWVDQAAIIDLTGQMDAEGQLSWNAPPGDWTLVRFGHVNTGAKNKPAPPEATGLECDKFSPAGAEQHFAGYIGRLSKPGGAADGGRLQGMVIDSWECYTQTWTPAMEQEFERRRGYALRPWMPALAGWVVNDHRASERFLRDWRATISDLIVENYYGRLAELGRAAGMKLSFETSIGDVSPGDILQYYKSADIPMCEFWQPNDPHNGGLEAKPIATTVSAAHIYGKPRIAAESFTCAPINWGDHPFTLKNLADRNFALGVTHLVFHTYTHNPLDRVPGTSFGSSIGTPMLRGQTWWKYMPLFAEYLARCQFMLEQGEPVADVLWYLGDDVDHKPRQDSPFPSGYHFDYLNADALLHRCSVSGGDLVIPEAASWRVLWLPREQCQRLTPATLVKLKELLNAGATVIGEAPLVNATLSGGDQADQAFTQLVAELWGTTPNASGDRRIGKGRLLWGAGLSAALAEIGITPDVTGTLSDAWCHRRVGDTDVYFVSADRVSQLDANLHFRARGKPEFWDPLSGRRTPVSVFHCDARGTSIPVQLPAAGSVFVVFRPGVAEPALEKILCDGKVLVDAGDATRVDHRKPYRHYGLSRSEPVQPWVKPSPLTAEILDGGRQFLAWKDGDFQFSRPNAEPVPITVTGTRVIPLGRGWSLAFPSGWDTPESIELEQVEAWSELADKPVSHFSGSATYRTTFSLDALKSDERLLIDLGRVGNIATVRLNGQEVGVQWAAPYRLDISAQTRAGNNQLEIEVTNTWHNRLAYDAGLPEAQRKTWTYAAPAATAPRELAGLAGPVRLHLGKLAQLPVATPIASNE